MKINENSIIIRPLKEEDAYTSVKWRNDPEVFKYTGNIYNKEITIDSELEWINKVIRDPNDKRFAIEVNEKYVGNIYLTGIDDEEAEYHIFIGDKNYWGKGIGKKASELLLDYGFNNLKLKKINLRVREANIKAYKLYISLGFKEIKKDDKFIYMSIKNKTL